MLHVGALNEKLNVTKDKTPYGTLKGRIEASLVDLEETIIGRLGSDLRVGNVDLGLRVEEDKDSYGKQKFEISSDNLVELTGPIGKIIYKEFTFETWGGTKPNDPNKNVIWFNPKFTFKYKAGGSNASDALWSAIWYDIDEDKWIFGREI